MSERHDAEERRDETASARLDPAVLQRLPPDFQKAVDFHGHLCPGLTIGYRASKIAMERLRVARGTDEELFGLVETDACGSDAFQVITGCTIGRGNLVFKDYGKQVFTLVRRADGRGIRVAMKYGALPPNPAYAELRQRVMAGLATPEEREEFRRLHLEQALQLLDLPEEQFATVRQVEVEPPPKARILPSVQCAFCGEAVMEPRARLRDGKPTCIPCAVKHGRGWEINV
ncbi:MAG: FmdE family protein [Bacillota bacterium]|nr:FmdE family protein [Bacillota bacterium]